jgi:hypothetical protein
VLPSSDFLKKVAKSKHLEINQSASEMISKQKGRLEMVYPSLGQLVTLYVLNREKLKEVASGRGKQLLQSVPAEVVVPSPNVATCSLLTIEECASSLFGLTCLHAVQLVVGRDAPYPAEDYDQLTLFVKHQCDVQAYLWDIHQHVLDLLPRCDLRHLTVHTLLAHVAKLLKQHAKQQPIFMTIIRIKEDFLEARAKFIQDSLKKPVQLLEGNVFHPLLDPEFLLQPIPSFDMMTFTLAPTAVQNYYNFLKHELCTDSEFQFTDESVSYSRAVKILEEQFKKDEAKNNNRYLSSEQESSPFSPLSAASDMMRPGNRAPAAASRMPPQDGSLSSNSTPSSISIDPKLLTFLNLPLEANSIHTGWLVSLLGFHSIKNRRIEQDEVYEAAYKKQFKGLADASFLNRNLSIGVCEIKAHNSTIFTYKGNTSEGSSGSPIVDEQLNVLGINFGCYHDVQHVQVAPAQQKTPSLAKQRRGPPFANNNKVHGRLLQDKIVLATDDEVSNGLVHVGKELMEQGKQLVGKMLPIKGELGATITGPQRLLLFDVEIEEPGATVHRSSLKNRNLAVSTNHPVFREWIKKWHSECTKMDALGKECIEIGSTQASDELSIFSMVTVDTESSKGGKRGYKEKPKHMGLTTIPLLPEKTKRQLSVKSKSKLRNHKRKS